MTKWDLFKECKFGSTYEINQCNTSYQWNILLAIDFQLSQDNLMEERIIFSTKGAGTKGYPHVKE